MLLSLAVFFSLLAVVTAASSSLKNSLAVLEANNSNTALTSKFKLVTEADRENFTTLYLRLCSIKGFSFPITESILEETLEELDFSAKSAHEYFFPQMLGNLLRAVVLFQLELQRDPTNNDLIGKGVGFACISLFLLFDYTDGIDQMTPLQAFKFLELIYRFGPKYKRYDAVFKRLFGRVRGEPIFKDAAVMLARYYLTSKNQQLPIKHFEFGKGCITELELFLSTFMEMIEPLENQSIKSYKRAVLDLFHIISLNPFNSKSSELIFRLLYKGYKETMFQDATLFRNWTRFVNSTDDIGISTIILVSSSMLVPEMQGKKVEIAIGGLYEALRSKSNFSDRFSSTFDSFSTEDKALLNDFVDSFNKYEQALSEIYVVSHDLKSTEHRNRKDDLNRLNGALETMSSFSKEMNSLDYEKYIEFADTCSLMIEYFITDSEDLKDQQVHGEGLTLALHSIAVLNVASLDDSSHAMLNFWRNSHNIFITINCAIEYAIFDQFQLSDNLFSCWIEFVERYIIVHGIENLGFDDLKRVNNTILALSNEADDIRINLLQIILNAYQFEYFVTNFADLLEASFGIPMPTVYSFYLSKSLIEFVETGSEDLKTFQNGSFLKFLRYISDIPDNYIPSALFDLSRALLGNKLF